MAVRETWVYPENGEPYLKGTQHATTIQKSGVTIMPDLPDFVSPIDGKLYSGRTGMRDHCARHDVVPNAELKGLPTWQTNSDVRSPEQRKTDANERKQMVADLVYNRRRY